MTAKEEIKMHKIRDSKYLELRLLWEEKKVKYDEVHEAYKGTSFQKMHWPKEYEEYLETQKK